MLTVSQLAKRYGLSRTAILYYEREGLLMPTQRGDNGYRWYGPSAEARLQKILAYRAFGLPVAQLSELLQREQDNAQEQVLRDQFDALEVEIAKLRLQQRAIIQYLEQPCSNTPDSDSRLMTKAGWTQIMRDAGFSDQDMHNWHIQFEKRDPAAHERFLQSLQIDSQEITAIRTWSRGDA